jgi:hypothetical protein
VARSCTVCKHADRAAIDEAIVSSEPAPSIARRYALSHDAVTRHGTTHIPKSLKAVHERRKERQAETLLDRVEGLYDEAKELLEQVKAERQRGLSLAALKELRNTLELIGRLTGELDQKPQVQILNVTQSADWQMLSSIIETALAPYPEARLAVVEGVQRALAAREEAG